MGYADGDTISFAATANAPVLTLGELLVSDDVTIGNLGFGVVTIDGSKAGQIFNVDAAAGAGSAKAVAFRNLALTNGSAAGDGGAVLIAAGSDVTMTAVNVTGNTAAGSGRGIANAGTLAFSASSFGGRLIADNVSLATVAGSGGGGLFNTGTADLGGLGLQISGNTASAGKADGGGGLNSKAATVTVSGGGFSGNTAALAGGAIENNAGTATLSLVSLTGTRAGVNGGALHASGAATTTIDRATGAGNLAGTNGGGLRITAAGKLTVTRSTVSGIAATRGGVYNDGTGGDITISDSTVSGNAAAGGGGVFLGRDARGPQLDRGVQHRRQRRRRGHHRRRVTAASSIFGNNTANTGRDIAGTLTSNGNNLISATAGATITGGAGDLLNVDPRVAPLADNGGPTRTHALLAGSPAVNAGSNPDGLTTDQAGNARVQGGRIDIGAFESAFTTTANASPTGVNDN